MVIGIPSNLLGMNIARFYHDSTLTASREVEDQLLSNYDTILKKKQKYLNVHYINSNQNYSHETWGILNTLMCTKMTILKLY